MGDLGHCRSGRSSQSRNNRFLCQESRQYAPLKTSRSPCPPESTTPASFRTGSISGVFARVASACSKTACKKQLQFLCFRSNLCCLSQLLLLATVRMVPSFGFITALYAVSTALLHSSCNCNCIQSPYASLMPLVKPRRSWERITPELPLAPRREPEEIALARVSISGSVQAAYLCCC